VHCTCLLSGVKRTSSSQREMSAFDPKRTCISRELGNYKFVISFKTSAACPLLALADIPYVSIDVAFGGKADITFCGAHVCF
jgi:hypothetical protein